MSSENTDIRNRRFYERKEFWIALASVAVVVCVRYAVEKHNDRPLTFRPVESVDAEPDYAHGVGIDFRRRLEARQEANLMPADENGWKLVLQAFGPIALDHKSFVERTPWEQLAGEYWFKREWTPLCEKYGIDPTVPPEFLTRLDLYEYLIKNGISGEEPEASDSDLSGWSAKERYWENYEEKTGRLDSQQVIDGYQRLLAKPWTKEEAGKPPRAPPPGLAVSCTFSFRAILPESLRFEPITERGRAIFPGRSTTSSRSFFSRSLFLSTVRTNRLLTRLSGSRFLESPRASRLTAVLPTPDRVRKTARVWRTSGTVTLANWTLTRRLSTR